MSVMQITDVLGLDLSLTSTGMATSAGTSTLRVGKLTGNPRLAAILAAVLDTAPGRLAVIEGMFQAQDGGTTLKLGGLGHLIRFSLWASGIPYVDIPPSTLKKFATGKGNAKKDDMLEVAIRKFGFEGHGNDEADAFLLRCMGLAAYGRSPVKLNADQRAIVDKIDWPGRVKETPQ